MSEHPKYATIWKECGKSSGIADRFYVPGFTGFLPFFLVGDELDAMQSGGLELKEWHLLAGILYGLYEFDNHPKPWNDPKDRDTFMFLLDRLGGGFAFDDPEKMVLDVAAKLRRDVGSVCSRLVLVNGLKLIPFSSKIRSDLICDIFAVAAFYDDIERLRPIPELIAETSFSEILPHAGEIICYYGLCTLVVLGEPGDEITAFLSDFVFPHVKLPNLKIAIKNLLDVRPFPTLKDLILES